MPFIVASASVVMSTGQSDGIGMQSVGLFGKLFLPVETFKHRLVRELVGASALRVIPASSSQLGCLQTS